MERGIAENVLEMALRGKPREPFYMVGRMEGQSVVLRAEKGKLRLMVDDEEGGKVQEMVYEVNPGEGREDRGGKGGEDEGREAGDGGEERAEGLGAYPGGEVPGSVVGMDGEAQAWGGLPRVGGGLGDLETMAGSGDGGDADGLAAPSPSGAGGGLESPSCRIIEEESGRDDERAGQETEEAARQPEGPPGTAGGCSGEEALAVLKDNPDGEGEKNGAGAGVRHSAGTQWSLKRDGRSGAVGDLAQDVLRVGGPSSASHGSGAGESFARETLCSSGCGEGGASEESTGPGEKVVPGGEDDRGERRAFGLRSSRG
jgi:hypothetical protein